MKAEAITGWLKSPANLPDAVTLDAALRAWPWFAPVRLMEATREHQQMPFSPKTLANLQLYAGNWLPAYSLLTWQHEEEDNFDLLPEEEEVFIETGPPKIESAEAETPAGDHISVEPEAETSFIQPLYTEDYFRHQGIAAAEQPGPAPAAQSAEPQTLMVVMSFAEWLTHFKTKTQKEKEEAQEKSALRSMWQQEKLAAAMEEDSEEIPEDVFEMAVSSITRENDIISEPLAQIYERQEKWNAAADMYRKLALKYPAKSTYFAGRAEAAKKRLL